MNIFTFIGEKGNDPLPEEPEELWAVWLVRLFGLGGTIIFLAVMAWVFVCIGIAIGVAAVNFWGF